MKNMRLYIISSLFLLVLVVLMLSEIQCTKSLTGGENKDNTASIVLLSQPHGQER
jgi:hypothetical protein